MRRDTIRLSRRHKFALYSAVTATFATGAVWIWLHYITTRGDDPISSPVQAWMIKLHGGFAMAVLVLIGTLLPMHVKFAWNAGRNRPNGITLFTVFGILIATGYGLYYLGNERLRSWTSIIHIVIGLALPIFIVVHIWRGRATRRVRHAFRVAAQNPR